MITNAKIAIFGLGIEGISLANFLKEKNEITVFDVKNINQFDQGLIQNLKAAAIKLNLGEEIKPENFDYVIHSAGVRPDNPKITKLVTQGAKLTSATKLFFDLCPCPIIGITGTKGKGTTSTLIYKFLKTKFEDVFLAGNIGMPMIDVLPKLTQKSLVVLELSSFQLMGLTKSPHVAVVLMITSEHLDWHKNQDEYVESKKSIVKNQSKQDFCVMSGDFETSRSFAKDTNAHTYFFSTQRKTNGTYVEKEKIISEINIPELICKTSDVLLPGRHNLQNVCAAISVAKIYGVSAKNIKSVLKSFKGLAHRLELVRTTKGVKYYNDSFATTPETTIAAIESFKNPKILILGGSSKKSNFTALVKKILTDKSIKSIILIGPEGDNIKNLLTKNNYKGQTYSGLTNMKEIVDCAQKQAKNGDVVLLSPACASFGMFKNYKDRGEQFTKVVKSL